MVSGEFFASPRGRDTGQLSLTPAKPLTPKGFALWSAPLEHFGSTACHHDITRLCQKTASGPLRICTCCNPVRWPIQWWTAAYLLFQSTTEDPGAPFECLGLDLAPGHISEWNYLID